MPAMPMGGKRPITQSASKHSAIAKGSGSAMKARSHQNPLSRGHNSMKTSAPAQIRGAANSTARIGDEPSDDCYDD